MVTPASTHAPRFSRVASPCLLVASVLAFIAGLVLVVFDRQEQSVFDALVSQAEAARPDAKRPSADDVLNLMHSVHTRLRGTPLAQNPSSTLNSKLHLTSSLEQLSNPSGMCASYSQVLAKTLMTAGYPVRKVGLAKGEQRAIHHVIEARIGDSWALLDALYNLAFRAPDGRLASAAEVSRDWATYRSQVPTDYNPDYDYQGFYYTNWDRIPVVGWIVRSSPGLSGWLHDQRVSLRFWFFNTYRWEAVICFVLGMGCWFTRRRLLRGTGQA